MEDTTANVADGSIVMTKVIEVRVPANMAMTLAEVAKEKGVSRSVYCLSLLTAAVWLTGDAIVTKHGVPLPTPKELMENGGELEL